jgi:hypothetical protein
MRLFKKYEFNTQEQAEEKIADLPHIEDELSGESYLEDNHTIVKLGYLYIEQPTFDADGEIEAEGIQSDKYSIDVLWDGLDESPYGWKTYEVEPEGNGVHTFAGRNF